MKTDTTPDGDPLDFPPVATKRRHDGWTPTRQRDFIVSLRDTGSVAAAAKAVGCTAQTAYRLRKRPDAGAFATAWDHALDEGRVHVFDRTVERALNNQITARFYRGRFVSLSLATDDRAMVAALGAMMPEPKHGKGYE